MTPDTREWVKQEFMAKYGFPGVLGAIDCTHVHLRAPADNAAIYVNRKGTHSINIQVICDALCNVTHVFANYPGSSHDSFILANSVIQQRVTFHSIANTRKHDCNRENIWIAENAFQMSR